MQEIFFEELDSTNAYCKRNYESLENLTFVSCLKQTSGKGRNDRKWESEKNNLLFSLLIKNQEMFLFAKEYSILSAYCVLKVLEEYGICDLSIKWPNDVYVKDQKICGILLEAISDVSMKCLVIGVGLNVNQIEFSESFITKATSMKKVLKKEIKINDLKNRLYSKMIEIFNQRKEGVSFEKEIFSYDYLKNKKAFAKIFDQEEEVYILGMNRDYSLCVNYKGKEFSLNSGEISFHKEEVL